MLLQLHCQVTSSPKRSLTAGVVPESCPLPAELLPSSVFCLHAHVRASYLPKALTEVCFALNAQWFAPRYPFLLFLCSSFAVGRRRLCRRLKQCPMSRRHSVLTEMLTDQAVVFKCYIYFFFLLLPIFVGLSSHQQHL